MDIPGFNSRQELEIFLFSKGSRPALWPTQPTVCWVLGVPSPNVKYPGREFHHAPPSGAKGKTASGATCAMTPTQTA